MHKKPRVQELEDCPIRPPAMIRESLMEVSNGKVKLDVFKTFTCMVAATSFISATSIKISGSPEEKTTTLGLICSIKRKVTRCFINKDRQV